jgi:poly-gamma-glutamate synthesis protein (capsule biosynthesis protein)
MGSPYPLAYDLRWPWLHLWPSTTEHVPLTRRPIAHDFTTEPVVARVACFGDLMGLTGDRLPAIAPELAALFRTADLIVGNCEAPVTHDEKDPRAFYVQRFRMATAYLREALDRLAIDPRRTVLSIANNHIGDQGDAGVDATLERMEALGVGVAGSRAEPVVVRRGIGIVAWTHWLNQPCDRVLRTADVIGRDFRAPGISTLLASPHWEWEFQHFPSAETIEQARALAACGFDAIAGHHPHVVQPIAWFGTTVCQFSLGNLMARTLTWPHRLISILELRVGASGRIAGYTCHPFVQLDDRIAPLWTIPARLRNKLTRRLGLLFDRDLRIV